MKTLCYICFLCFLLSSCARASRDEVLLYETIAKHKKKFKGEGLSLVGSGGAIPDDVKGFILHYEGKKNIEIPEARRIFVTAMEEMLTLINDNEELRQYLVEYPFGPSRVKLLIGFSDPSLNYPKYPHVGLILYANEKIHYSYYNHEKGLYSDSRDFSEPYEEAKRIVLAEQSANSS